MKSPLPSLRGLPWRALLLAAGALPALTLHAQQPPPAVDPAAVLAALKDLKAKQTQIVAKEKGQVLAAINAAMADPGKAYEQAVAAVEFQGGDATRIIEWRKKNGDLLRDKNFIAALRTQLAYISLTWQHSMGAKTRDQLPALYDYANSVVANYESLSSYEQVTRKSVGDNVFATWFQIGPYINGLPDWESNPFNVDGIFQKAILPELRKLKDPRLLAYWDEKIQTEAARVDKGQNSLAVNKFNNIRRPNLQWSRAEDELVLGDQPRAVADMLALIKAHPDHPEFDKWAARLTEVVTPKAEVIVRDAAPATGN